MEGRERDGRGNNICFIQKRGGEGKWEILIKNVSGSQEKGDILKLIYCFTLKLN